MNKNLDGTCRFDSALMKESNQIFQSVIPTLESYFSGKIYTTECSDNQICKILDYGCGIDAIVVSNEVFGIAHRINRSDINNFTIRTEINSSNSLTEFDHISRSGIKPRYHVQTIVKNGNPVAITVCQTSNLVYAINHGLATIRTARSSGDQFASIMYDDLRRHGIPIDILSI